MSRVKLTRDQKIATLILMGWEPRSTLTLLGDHPTPGTALIHEEKKLRILHCDVEADIFFDKLPNRNPRSWAAIDDRKLAYMYAGVMEWHRGR